jgi:hypothetical protein
MSRRLKDQIPVEYRLTGNGAAQVPRGRALTRDLSAAGLMLEADCEIAAMSTLHLDFALGSPPCFLKATARVCWIQKEAEDQYRLGICFSAIDDEDRNWIRNHVALHWDSGGRATG